MAWTVTQIISKFRDLTGRKSSDQISDANILIEINHYYQYIFPLEAHIIEFKGWYTFDTTATIGTQTLPDTVLSVGPPVYSNDDDAVLWTDEKRFYQEYPHDYDSENVPTDILLLDRTLILRPIPDDTYEIRLRKTSSTPDALVDGESLDVDTYGQAIAYGSSIMYLLDQAERDAADEHTPTYQYHLGIVRSYIIGQQPTGRRPRGGQF